MVRILTGLGFPPGITGARQTHDTYYFNTLNGSSGVFPAMKYCITSPDDPTLAFANQRLWQLWQMHQSGKYTTSVD